MNGYAPKDISVTSNGTDPYGASLTNSPISRDATISAGGSRCIRIEVKTSSVVVGAGITVKFQTSAADTWISMTSANSVKAITASGVTVLTLLDTKAADQPDLPLGDKIRVVITTGAGSSLTVDSVNVLQEL